MRTERPAGWKRRAPGLAACVVAAGCAMGGGGVRASRTPELGPVWEEWGGRVAPAADTIATADVPVAPDPPTRRAGVYPAEEHGASRGLDAGRGPGAWRPAGRAEDRLDVAGGSGLLAADAWGAGGVVDLPASPWPRPVRVVAAGGDSLVFAADPLPLAAVAGEVRCRAGGEVGMIGRLSAEPGGPGVLVARWERAGSGTEDCVVSSRGAARLRAFVLSLWAAGRSVYSGVAAPLP